MVKKAFNLATVFVMIAIFAGSGQAAVVTYDDAKLLNQSLYGVGTWSYSHDMPGDFGVPPDTVIEADLNISYERALAVGYLSIQGQVVPGSAGFVFASSGQTPDFAIDSLLNPWTEGSPLVINVTGAGWITLLSSNLHLVYENNVSPVPEPGTMMLLGGGLIGLAGWGRKKFRK